MIPAEAVNAEHARLLQDGGVVAAAYGSHIAVHWLYYIPIPNKKKMNEQHCTLNTSIK